EEFDAAIFDKKEYAARAEKLREILRRQSEANPDIPDPDYNNYLYNFGSLITTSIKGFLYTSGLTAFSFGNNFRNLSQDIRLAIHRIEKVSNQMRSKALNRTFKEISGSAE
ncbi:MAG: hypothetical protein ACI4Q4_03465, partial [Oscillospiraceae bacterium]